MSCPSTTLNTGAKMPLVGLGTWKSEVGAVKAAVIAAIDAGYTHIDCAMVYGNEKEVGQAFSERIGSKIKREDIFVTSKLWNIYHDPATMEGACRQTLADLNLDYLDLYLIHWPVGFENSGNPPVMFPGRETGKWKFQTTALEEVWKGMEKLVGLGLVKAIGISNFNCAQTERVVKCASIMPAVNQVECHVLLTQNKLRALLKKHNIVATAYSPFGSGDKRLLENEKVKAIGDKYGKSIPQVLIRFHMQRGDVVLPKSITPARIQSNYDVFDFEMSAEDIKALEEMNENKRFIIPPWADSPEWPFAEEL